MQKVTVCMQNFLLWLKMIKEHKKCYKKLFKLYQHLKSQILIIGLCIIHKDISTKIINNMIDHKYFIKNRFNGLTNISIRLILL